MYLIFSLASIYTIKQLEYWKNSVFSGSLPTDTIIPKNLYEAGMEDSEDLDDNDRKQMTKLKKAAAAIEQAQQAKLKRGKNKR